MGLLVVLLILCATSAQADTLADPFSGSWAASIDAQSSPDGQVTFSTEDATTGSSALQQMGGQPCSGVTTYYQGQYRLPASPSSSFVYTGSLVGCSSKSSQGHVQMDGRFKDPSHTGHFHIAVCVDVEPSENRFVGSWNFDNGISKPFAGSFSGSRAGSCSPAGGGGHGGVTFAGNWNTDYGLMKLGQAGHRVSGTYKYCGGKATITGTVSGSVLDGMWSQPCNSHSGRIHFVLNHTGNAFKGTWNYGRAEPKYRWNGTRA